MMEDLQSFANGSLRRFPPRSGARQQQRETLGRAPTCVDFTSKQSGHLLFAIWDHGL